MSRCYRVGSREYLVIDDRGREHWVRQGHLYAGERNDGTLPDGAVAIRWGEMPQRARMEAQVLGVTP